MAGIRRFYQRGIPDGRIVYLEDFTKKETIKRTPIGRVYGGMIVPTYEDSNGIGIRVADIEDLPEEYQGEVFDAVLEQKNVYLIFD